MTERENKKTKFQWIKGIIQFASSGLVPESAGQVAEDRATEGEAEEEGGR
jgi:hypothetical protein